MLISSIFLVSLNSHLEPDTPRARPGSIRSSQTKPKTFFTMLVRMERGRAPTLSMEIEGACNPECCWKGAWKWSSMDGQTNQATALMKLYLKPFSSGLLLHEPINVCGLKITDNIKCIGKDMERLELIYCWWENKLKTTLEYLLPFSSKVKYIIYDSAISPLPNLFKTNGHISVKGFLH